MEGDGSCVVAQFESGLVVIEAVGAIFISLGHRDVLSERLFRAFTKLIRRPIVDLLRFSLSPGEIATRVFRLRGAEVEGCPFDREPEVDSLWDLSGQRQGEEEERE
jgi:hypothetical protein